MPYSLKTWAQVLMTPELEHMISTVDTALHAFGLHAVITSGLDGVHKRPNSRHYRSEALDFRISDWPPDKTEYLTTIIRRNIGTGYFVLLHKTHLHIEVRT